MTFMPDGEFEPTAREIQIGEEQIEKLNLDFSKETQKRIAQWLTAVLCCYRLELLTGRTVIGRDR